jgi:LPXTG-motif cell wall-anchored protein
MPTPRAGTDCDAFRDDENAVRTSLQGLPATLVAGSGWHEFTYRTVNISSRTLAQVHIDLNVRAGENHPSLKDLQLAVEWYDATSGQWRDVAEQENNRGFFAGARYVRSGEYVDARLRIKAGSTAPANKAFFLTIGSSVGDGDRICGEGDVQRWDVDIAAAGTSTGGGQASGHPVEPGASVAPSGSASPSVPATLSPSTTATPRSSTPPPASPSAVPAGVTAVSAVNINAVPAGSRVELPVTGRLAQTGTSKDATPTVTAVGGAAVVLGAGALVLSRRRKAASGADQA